MNPQVQAGIIQNNLEQPPSESRLEGKWLQAARVSWIILALLALALLITSLPGYLTQINSGLPGFGPRTTTNVSLQLVNSIMSLVSAGLSLWLSLLLFRRRFNNQAITAVSFYLLVYGIVLTGPLEVWSKYWLGHTNFALKVQSLLMATPTIAFLTLFPNGTFVPRWTRWLLILAIPWHVIAIFLPISEQNFTGLIMLSILWVPAIGLGLYAQVFRYRNISTPTERQQTRWVLFGFSLWLGYILISIYPYLYLRNLPPGSPLPWWSTINELGWWASLNIIPVTLMLAITRSRLWDIDVVINRTLVYSVLTLITMAIYALVVGGAGILLDTGENTIVAFLATGLIAILFQPMRARLQLWVNRLMYGERDDPAAVLTKLGEKIEKTSSPEAILASMVDIVGKTLNIPYVAIELGEIDELAASYGTSVNEPLRLPLVHQGKNVGFLVVEQRGPDEAFSAQDLKLLENIARQVGVIAHNVSLTADLQRSRQRIVTAREEERRRLRRDLHDGLGPQLASQTLTLNAVEKLVDRDPEKAKILIKGLKAQSQEAITSIRHLIYELRPPALDELGLVEAVKEGSANYRGTVKVDVNATKNLPSLPAAVEVAAYHITQEAIVNAIKHAQASHCRVQFEVVGHDLSIEVADDGRGLPDGLQAGVGLQSMRERVSELNGQIELDSSAGNGTRVRVWLPLPRDTQ